MTTKDDIRDWLKRGKAQGASFMLVVCDTYDWGDYPVYVKPTEDLAEKAKGFHGVNMQKVMECYDLDVDWERQLNEPRSWNGWRP